MIALREVRAALAAFALAATATAAQAGEARCVAAPAGLEGPLAGQVQLITSRTLAWAQAAASGVLSRGRVPSPELERIAREVGVRHPEKVRIVEVDRIAVPDDPLLRMAAARAKLTEEADGLTLGYAVMLRRAEAANPRLLRHELRHVAQYEACGGLEPFLAVHLPHLLAAGYEESPFERDAADQELTSRSTGSAR